MQIKSNKGRGKPEKFIFLKLDNIGAAAAEEDRKFLEECFVDIGYLDTLCDCSDPKGIVVGRTGSGKTALLEQILSQKERVISINPESLSLSYISNSTILKFLSELGVKFDIFFKLLWRHVFTVELLKYHFKIKKEDEGKSFKTRILNLFPIKEEKYLKALDYIDRWGDKFWEETEYRVKEVTTKLENAIKGSLTSTIPALDFSVGGSSILTNEQKQEVVNRAQRIVDKVQIRQLSDIIDLLDKILGDPQKKYYLIIDRLDERWVEDSLRYRLIRALIETIRDFHKIRHVKIIIAIRLDLLRRVFKFTRDAGFQEEKYESLYLDMNWGKKQLIEVANRRINLLLRYRYMKKGINYEDLLPKKIQNIKTIDYILKRTMLRPRDIILFLNNCIKEAVNQSKITKQMVLNAEGEYSIGRFNSLLDEWHSDYPDLELFIPILKTRNSIFALESITHQEFEDFCLNIVVKSDFSNREYLCRNAFEVAEGKLDSTQFKFHLFSIFYQVGLIGLKLESYERYNWITDGRRSISGAEINENTLIAIHPMFWRILGIKNINEK